MSEHCAVVFADIAGSTLITETLGDTGGRAFIKEVIDPLAALTEKLKGSVVTTIGDEIMCTFPTALDGIVAAVEMQRAVQRIAPIQGLQPKIRVGVNWGEVVPDDRDVFGDVVNVAARVVGMAKADQILTTGGTIGSLGDVRVPLRSLGEHGLKGRERTISIHEVLWGDDMEELTAQNAQQRALVDLTLFLRLGERDVEVRGTEVRTLGRGEDCDIVVADSAVSRAHAKLVGRGSGFYLADHSTNGTFLHEEGRAPVFVHQDEVLLQGSGVLRLGREIEDPEGPMLHFRVEIG